MAVYRFRVTFEDYDDVSRDIEIKSTQTFDDLHHAIHTYIGFDASKPASFYMSDDNWKKGKEITTRDLKKEERETVSTMSKSRLCDFIIDPHQKIYYLFDPAAVWTFRVELIKIAVNEDSLKTYPNLVKSQGEAPKQYPPTKIEPVPEPEDFVEEPEEEEEAGVLEIEGGIDADEIPEGIEKLDEGLETPSDDEEIIDLDGKPEDDEL